MSHWLQEIKLFNLLVQTDGIPEVSEAFENREAGSADAFRSYWPTSVTDR